MRRNALRLLTGFFLICFLVLPFAAFAESHGHYYRGGGGVIVAPHYPYYYYPYRGWGWGAGWGWGYPYWGYGSYYYESTGTIKIKDPNKLDQVYLNDAYAGTVDKMKSIKLDPGRYTIQLRRDGKELLNQNVYVVAGKTVEITVGGN